MASMSDEEFEKYMAFLNNGLQDWQKHLNDITTSTFTVPTIMQRPQTATEQQIKMEEMRRRAQEKRDLFYQRYSTPPSKLKDALNGKHRRPNPQAHSNTSQQPNPGDDGADSLDYSLYSFTQSLYADADKPRSIPYAGIRTGEVTGIRGWFVAKNDVSGYRLCSLAHVFIWEPGQIVKGNINEAVYPATVTQDFKPIYGGVYAFKQDYDSTLLSELFDIAQIFHAPEITVRFAGASIVCAGLACGTVEMWGDVVEHETGYRASHAKLKSIDRVIGNVDLEALQREYHLPNFTDGSEPLPKEKPPFPGAKNV